MKHFGELTSIKKGDYLDIKYADGLVFVRVLNVDNHHRYIGLTKIRMRVLTEALQESRDITWDFEYLAGLLNKVIQSPSELKLIRLLYD
jgi:hypothetical protein